ncbi:MAG: shikimate dehydrogenase [bacterium]
MVEVNGSTKLTGIIGYPVTHSVSPQMHNAAYAKLGLNYCYLPISAKPEDLERVLEGIRILGFVGINVTIPHKEAVIPFLDEVTKIARLTGAVNVILNQEGRLVGYNTDGPGFINSLKEDSGLDVAGKRAVVLGAGGGAKAVAIMLAQDGIKNLVISDLIYEKAEDLCEYINSHFGMAPYACPAKGNELRKLVGNCDLLVNATPVGMHPNVNECPIEEDCKISKSAVVYDLVYNPLETKLLKLAKANGAKALSGIGMLIRQGTLAFSLFTEEEAPKELMKEAALKALKSFPPSSLGLRQ